MSILMHSGVKNLRLHTCPDNVVGCGPLQIRCHEIMEIPLCDQDVTADVVYVQELLQVIEPANTG
jgi:hypothetical protein